MATLSAELGTADDKSRRISGKSSSQRAEPPKLRASCDGCYLSKVKCSKATPECSRCASHGISCRYSPSQRIGKPRRLQSEGVEPNFQCYRPELEVMKNPDLRSWSMQTPLLDWSTDASVATSDTHSNCIDDQTAWQPCLDGGLSSSYPVAPSGPTDAIPHQLLSPVDSMSSFAMTDPTIMSPGDRSRRLRQQTQAPAMLTQEVGTSRGVYSSAISTDLDYCTNSMGFGPQNIACSCSVKSFEVLRTLHEHSDNSQIPFDTVLAVNKDITRQISGILDCRCIPDTSSVMTLAAAIARMISWYRSIFCNLPSSTRSAAPITLGAYRLDDADEKCVKIQVALNELKKIDALVARMSQSSYSSHAQQEARVYADLTTLLRRKLREIVEELQRDLRMDFTDGV